uniref:Uncharacterized protein n=1 Tax=Arundo donax TaxID=35708 RepID=A0A0A9AG26_ARUDO
MRCKTQIVELVVKDGLLAPIYCMYNHK